MERSTEVGRFKRANALLRKAREAEHAGNYKLKHWRERRAHGQLARFDRVRECGSTDIVTRCGDCQTEARRIVSNCAAYRVCLECRGRRAAEYRSRFRVGRDRHLGRVATLMTGGAPGGRWSEHFLTLTIPHSGDIARDIERLCRAWRRFWKRIDKHLRLDRSVVHVAHQLAWMRVIEVTPGTSHDGHAHLHVWIFSPFIHHQLLRLWWGRSLQEVGAQVPTRSIGDVLQEVGDDYKRGQLETLLRTRRNGDMLEAVPWPVVDIRACTGDVAHELSKYLIKDMERDDAGERVLIEPELFARIYEALEARRVVQASLGFLRDDASCSAKACAHCGSANTERRREPTQRHEERAPINPMDDAPATWRRKPEGGTDE